MMIMMMVVVVMMMMIIIIINNEGVVVDFDISKTNNRKKLKFPISKYSNALFDSYLLDDRTMLVTY